LPVRLGRPIKNLPGLPARFTGVDMLIIRELTETCTLPSSTRSSRAWYRASRWSPSGQQAVLSLCSMAKLAAAKRHLRPQANILKLADGCS